MELKEIRRLSPEERIKKLKEITEKNKKEIEDAQRLIKESNIELEEERAEKEQIPIPQLRSVDATTLFGKGTQEEQMFRTKRYEPGRLPERGEEQQPTPLERRVEEEDVREEQRREAERQQYFDRKTTEELYNIRRDLSGSREEAREAQQDIYVINQELRERREDMERGDYKPISREAIDILQGEQVRRETYSSERVAKALYRR